MIHISEIIKKHRLNSLYKKAGLEIKCRKCGELARIFLGEGRYYVECPTCQDFALLKEYNAKSSNIPLSYENG